MGFQPMKIKGWKRIAHEPGRHCCGADTLGTAEKWIETRMGRALSPKAPRTIDSWHVCQAAWMRFSFQQGIPDAAVSARPPYLNPRARSFFSSPTLVRPCAQAVCMAKQRSGKRRLSAVSPVACVCGLHMIAVSARADKSVRPTSAPKLLNATGWKPVPHAN
jgi:hypothetical protein